MEQFEQLLTCAICLDRYRNPKLLPCQHSFCMEPCMEGLIDYVRRQVKCPECRAEHRIPYQGVQAFPTNVTLQRFLELHIEISGELPDPTSGQTMERCAVCSEKAYCVQCVHCDKRVCPECKSAHMDILRREIARINNQIRRGLHRLQDALALVEKNTTSLRTNCNSVSEEVEEINRRLAKALKDRTEHLKNDIDRYLGTEMRTLDTLRDNLELEIANIASNCDLADKHMSETTCAEWDDRELMDAKEIFLRTVEFIRNFECADGTDYARRVRFVMAHDPNQLVLHVAGYGDLNVSHGVGVGVGVGGGVGGGGGLSVPGQGSGLMRSKSDHRLAYRQQLEDSGRYGETATEQEPLLGGRRFGERPPPRPEPSRYGRTTTDYDYDDEPSRPARSRFRSRFARHQDNDSDTETTAGGVASTRGVRFSVSEQGGQKEREKVLDTEDVARGPLSGISRLCDSPRVMKRLQESGKKKDAPVAAPPPTPAPKVVAPTVTARRTSTTAAPPAAQRQVSEEDEIARIKRQNKGATGSSDTPTTTTTTTPVTETRPVSERVAALKQRGVGEESDDSRRSSPAGSPTRRTSNIESEAESDGSVSRAAAAASRRSSASSDVQAKPKAARSASSDSSTSSDSSATAAARSTGAAFTTAEVKQKFLARAPVVEPPKDKPFQSRFLNRNAQTTVPPPPPAKEEEEETETSSEEETESESEEEEPAKSNKDNKEMAKTDIGPLLARSAQARDNSSPRRDDTTTTTPARGYTSRFLNKSRSTAVVDDDPPDSGSDARYPSGRSRYAALKDRRTRIARSRSTHNFGDDDAEDYEEPMSPTTSSPSAYLASRGYNTASSASELSRSRSSHALKSRESSPERGAPERDGAALSSWARYLKNKYGNRSTTSASGSAGTGSPATNSGGAGASDGPASRRLSLGLPLHATTNDDESKNTLGSPTSLRTAAIGPAGSCHRTRYLGKRRQQYQIGGRGSEPGLFTWPRGVAAGPDGGTVAVADSSNHRVQVFDSQGRFLQEFGGYGAGDGEFDCLAGVAVNRIGQFIIADRYNHRVQVFDPSGRFLRAFGSQGAADGRFNYPWGVATDALGFIYVCDKENHRVQVFQSDGTFVGKFGSCGSRSGQLDHPHYVAVSSTNRVVVSDSNNHRVQIFDVNGRVLSSFGTEGSEDGQFKFPKGVAVDDQGYICVADSGNNRVQIFHPDGTFLRAFGSWGSGDAEFKGLEGVAISSNGAIVVCDRENHRVQVF